MPVPLLSNRVPWVARSGLGHGTKLHGLLLLHCAVHSLLHGCADDDHGLRLHSLLHGVLRKKGLWELIGSGCFVVQTKPECRTAIYVREPSKPMSQVSAICPLRDGEWDKCTKEYPFISDRAREMLG